MSVATRAWKVHPHGHLTQVTENILTVTGTILMPAGRLPRRMTVVSGQSRMGLRGIEILSCQNAVTRVHYGNGVAWNQTAVGN